jgi:hypothetical protein
MVNRTCPSECVRSTFYKDDKCDVHAGVCSAAIHAAFTWNRSSYVRTKSSAIISPGHGPWRSSCFVACVLCELLHAEKKMTIVSCCTCRPYESGTSDCGLPDLPWSLHSSSHADNNFGAQWTPLASSQASSASQADLGLISLHQTRLLGRPLNVPIPHS